MRFFRVAACLLALCFSFSTLAAGAEVTYSGVPGKWKRSPKGAKDKTSESEEKNEEQPKEKGKRTITLPKPEITVTQPKPAKK